MLTSMGNWRRRLGQAAIALCVASGVWLLVTAVRGGWDAANPIASVLGGGAGIASLLVSLGVGPRASAAAGDPPAPPPPAIPDWVVDRDEAEQIVAAVCIQAGVGRPPRSRRTGRGGTTAVGITTGLHGAGGFGKTTLAHMVCAHPKVRRAFRGRVYVVTVGRNVRGRAAIAAKVAEATRFITGDTLEAGDDPGRAGDHLGRLLAQRPRTLLVIDDVWEAEQLEPFLRGAEEHCVRLVTTRKPAVLPPQSTRAVVDRMSPAQARAVLTHHLEAALPEALLEALVKATGRWALLLRLVNQLIAVQVATGVHAVTAAQALLDRLRALGPTGADPDMPLELDDPVRRNTAVRASIQAATELLPSDGGRRFAELGIFAEDEVIPLPLVALLWSATGDLTDSEARALSMQMADLSLLTLDGSVTGGAVALHDVVRDYLRSELADTVAAVNTALLDAIAAALPHAHSPGIRAAWWQTTDGYLLDHLIEHLLDAGRAAEAEAVASDPRWVQARLRQRGPTAPWRDLDLINSPTARGLAMDLARAAHLLSPTDPPHALDSVLRSRLSNLPHWNDQPHVALHPTLANRWPPPDLPDPSLVRTLTGSSDEVRTAAFSPDGALLATGGDDGQVRLWNPVTGSALRTLISEPSVRAVGFSPDGTVLATAGGQGRVTLWSPATGTAIRTLPHHGSRVNALAFTADGAVLATLTDQGQVWLWDPATGDARPDSPLNAESRVRAVVFSPDSTVLATADDDGRVCLWNTATRNIVCALSERVHGIRTVAYSPDGTLLATAGDDRRVRLWDPATGQAIRSLTGHHGYVNTVAFSPNGTMLASAGYDQVVRLWDPTPGVAVRALTGHEGYVNAVAFSPDGALLVTAGSDRAVRLRDPAASIHAGGGTGVRQMAFAAGMLATADDDGFVRLWDPEDGTRLRNLTNYIRGVRTLAFRSDGTMLATVGDDGHMWIWSPATGSPAHPFTDEGIRGVRAIAFHPAGTALATASDRGIDLWDPTVGNVQRTLTGAGLQGVQTMIFSLDGSVLATANDQGSIGLWDPAAGAVRRTLTDGNIPGVRAIAISGDGTTLATVSSNGAVHIWDTTTGTVLGALTGHEGRVTAVAFNGRRLATAGDDGTLRVWDPHARQTLTMMRTDTPLRCCTWSPDGRVLFAGGRGGLFGYDYHPGTSSP
ncbi:NB-ARC domain-containing protein [Streptomyces hygroscopicus]|uniref:NB-ARC domain-containing protein n=1 Tax=Streptomyces hygroscopicus TaxID=1912 RepID=UPI002AD4A6D8|nr:NB-ARC domain-containing protein [Streptomyces hygroscopicus]